tara:strand:+ start:70 stop:285 length:216 start_codon:yes stop_codon:yes gene_type:complete
MKELFSKKILTKNRCKGFILGVIATAMFWYSLVLFTQTDVKIKPRQYIGLCFAILGFIVGFLKFCFTVETN